jgi:hypothetical protein
MFIHVYKVVHLDITPIYKYNNAYHAYPSVMNALMH